MLCICRIRKIIFSFWEKRLFDNVNVQILFLDSLIKKGNINKFVWRLTVKYFAVTFSERKWSLIQYWHNNRINTTLKQDCLVKWYIVTCIYALSCPLVCFTDHNFEQSVLKVLSIRIIYLGKQLIFEILDWVLVLSILWKIMHSVNLLWIQL